MLITAALFALAIDTQEPPPAAFITPQSEPQAQAGVSAEAQAQAQEYATQMIGYVERVIAEQAAGRFALVDTDTLVADLTPLLVTVMNYGDAPAGEYTMDFQAAFFALAEGADPEGPYCHEGVESTMASQAVTDLRGNEMMFRGCWGGIVDPETERLTGAVLYQMQNGPHHTQYQGLIAGPDEAGVRERLVLLEPVIGRLTAHTVFVPEG